MTLKKWGILLLLVAFVAVLVVGCGGKQATPQTPPANEEPAAEEPAAEEPAAEEPAEEPADDMEEELKDGVYVGVGEGFGGEIKLEVTVVGGEITKIEVIEHNETETIGGASFEELIQSALSSHDDEFDTVSGASKTSEGFWQAIEDVHDQATM